MIFSALAYAWADYLAECEAIILGFWMSASPETVEFINEE